jgi:hypothetical protein
MSNARLYAKIMRHLEETTGTGFWDFRTLNLTHPQLADCLYRILLQVIGNSLSNNVILNHYVPRRLWGYESEVTV